MVMEAPPSAPLEMPEPDFLLELLIITLDAPAQLGEVDQAIEGDVVGKGREPVFGWFALTLWPFDQQPFLRARMGTLIIAMGSTPSHTSKARNQRFSAAFPPFDRAPSPFRKPKRKRLDANRLMSGIAAKPRRRPATARPPLRCKRRSARRPHRRGRLNARDIGQVQGRHVGAQRTAIAIASVEQHHGAWQPGATSPAQVFKRDLRLGGKRDVVGNAGLAP